MKNKIYYLGLISLMLTTAGTIFKIMHWPFAGILITLGMIMLILAFIPAALISSFKNEVLNKYKFLYILIGIIFMADFTGVLFKVMHWPGAGILVLIIMPLPFIVVLPAYLYTIGKENELDYKSFIAILFFFAYFAAISALLALGVSKNVINSYTNSAITLEQMTNQINQQCIEKYNVLKKNTIDSIEFENIQKIVKKSDKLCHSIDNLTRELLDHPARESQLNVASFIWKIKYKDASLSPDLESSVKIVKSEIDEYKELMRQADADQNPSILLEAFTDGSDKGPEFYKRNLLQNKIVVSGIERLNLIKYHVRLAELEALSN